MLWICALGYWDRKHRDVKGRGPEPRNAMEVGGEETKAFISEASRRERST
jgi:hypothetical protein